MIGWIGLATRFPGPAHSFHYLVVPFSLTPSESFCFKKHILFKTKRVASLWFVFWRISGKI